MRITKDVSKAIIRNALLKSKIVEEIKSHVNDLFLIARGQRLPIYLSGWNALPSAMRGLNGTDFGIKTTDKITATQLFDDEIYSEYEDLAHKREDLISRYETLYWQLAGLVNSATTTDKLAKVWPEGVQFFPAGPIAVITNYPAVCTADINTALNLGEAKP